MTKDELKQEAENKLDEWSDPDMGCAEGYCYSEVAEFMFRFAEPREKCIAELKEKLEKETAHRIHNFNKALEWKEKHRTLKKKENAEQLTEAKELIKNIIRVTWGEGWSYSLDWKVKAEQFLEEVENG